MDINPHKSRDTPVIEVAILERRILDAQSAVSKYKVGKSIVTVKSFFSSGKTYQDLLFRLIWNKLEK